MSTFEWRETWGPRPVTVGLDSIREVVPDAATARRVLLQSGGSGWVCTLDAVKPFDGTLADDEIPLHADVRISGRESLCLRFDGGWTLWRYVEREEGDLLAVDEKRATHDGDGVWRVYWRKERGPHDVAVYKPHAARLLRANGEK